jgi:hypothetical protein
LPGREQFQRLSVAGKIVIFTPSSPCCLPHTARPTPAINGPAKFTGSKHVNGKLLHALPIFILAASILTDPLSYLALLIDLSCQFGSPFCVGLNDYASPNLSYTTITTSSIMDDATGTSPEPREDRGPRIPPAKLSRYGKSSFIAGNT